MLLSAGFWLVLNLSQDYVALVSVPVVADVDERTVLVKVDGEVKLRVDKSSIQKDLSDNSAPEEKK